MDAYLLEKLLLGKGIHCVGGLNLPLGFKPACQSAIQPATQAYISSRPGAMTVYPPNRKMKAEREEQRVRDLVLLHVLARSAFSLTSLNFLKS